MSTQSKGTLHQEGFLLWIVNVVEMLLPKIVRVDLGEASVDSGIALPARNAVSGSADMGSCVGLVARETSQTDRWCVGVELGEASVDTRITLPARNAVSASADMGSCVGLVARETSQTDRWCVAWYRKQRGVTQFTIHVSHSIPCSKSISVSFVIASAVDSSTSATHPFLLHSPRLILISLNMCLPGCHEL